MQPYSQPQSSFTDPSCRSLFQLRDRSKLDELTIQEPLVQVLQVPIRLKEVSRDPHCSASFLYGSVLRGVALLEGAPFLAGATKDASALWNKCNARDYGELLLE